MLWWLSSIRIPKSNGSQAIKRWLRSVRIFNLDAAQNYAEGLKLHELRYPKSIVTFLVCNRQETSLQPWYQREMEAIRLMEKTGQTYLDESFQIFTRCHIDDLKKLENRKETA